MLSLHPTSRDHKRSKYHKLIQRNFIQICINEANGNNISWSFCGEKDQDEGESPKKASPSLSEKSQPPPSKIEANRSLYTIVSDENFPTVKEMAERLSKMNFFHGQGEVLKNLPENVASQTPTQTERFQMLKKITSLATQQQSITSKVSKPPSTPPPPPLKKSTSKAPPVPPTPPSPSELSEKTPPLVPTSLPNKFVSKALLVPPPPPLPSKLTTKNTIASNQSTGSSQNLGAALNDAPLATCTIDYSALPSVKARAITLDAHFRSGKIKLPRLSNENALEMPRKHQNSEGADALLTPSTPARMESVAASVNTDELEEEFPSVKEMAKRLSKMKFIHSAGPRSRAPTQKTEAQTLSVPKAQQKMTSTALSNGGTPPPPPPPPPLMKLSLKGPPVPPLSPSKLPPRAPTRPSELPTKNNIYHSPNTAQKHEAGASTQTTARCAIDYSTLPSVKSRNKNY